MLLYQPKKRYSAQQALNHQWIQHNAYTAPLKKQILSNLTTFQSKSRFRHAIMTFMATRMISKEESIELRKTFQALDSDGNG